VQKFATARWLANGCHSTPTVHIRKENPRASAKPKVRDNRMTPTPLYSVTAQMTGSVVEIASRALEDRLTVPGHVDGVGPQT